MSNGSSANGDYPRYMTAELMNGQRVGIAYSQLIAHDGRLWEVPDCPKCGTRMQQVGAFVAGPPDWMCPTHGNADMQTVLFSDGSFTVEVAT